MHTDQMDAWDQARQAHERLRSLSAKTGGSWWARLKRWWEIQQLIDTVRYCAGGAHPDWVEDRDPRTVGPPRWYMGG